MFLSICRYGYPGRNNSKVRRKGIINGNYNGTPIIQACYIQGESSSIHKSAIYCINDPAIIRNNYICGDPNGAATITKAIFLNASSSIIYNNIINGGPGIHNDSHCITLQNTCAPVIRNNTIFDTRESSANQKEMIYLGGNGSYVQLIDIENNIIFSNTTGVTAIYSDHTDNSDPNSISNNNFFNITIE